MRPGCCNVQWELVGAPHRRSYIISFVHIRAALRKGLEVRRCACACVQHHRRAGGVNALNILFNVHRSVLRESMCV